MYFIYAKSCACGLVGSNAKWRFVLIQLAAKLKVYEYNDLFSPLCKQTESILQNSQQENMLLKSALQKLGRRWFARASTSILSSKGSSHKLVSLEFRSPADIFTRSLSSRKQNVCPSYEMKAWYINEYGSNDVLEFGRRPLPTLRRPTDILVRVDAASVNPIDFRMRSGYGETLLNLWRKLEDVDEFPLILGRDFSGEVVKTGRMARRFRAGDKVSCIQGMLRPYACAFARFI